MLSRQASSTARGVVPSIITGSVQPTRNASGTGGGGGLVGFTHPVSAQIATISSRHIDAHRANPLDDPRFTVARLERQRQVVRPDALGLPRRPQQCLRSAQLLRRPLGLLPEPKAPTSPGDEQQRECRYGVAFESGNEQPFHLNNPVMSSHIARSIFTTASKMR